MWGAEETESHGGFEGILFPAHGSCTTTPEPDSSMKLIWKQIAQVSDSKIVMEHTEPSFIAQWKHKLRNFVEKCNKTVQQISSPVGTSACYHLKSHCSIWMGCECCFQHAGCYLHLSQSPVTEEGAQCMHEPSLPSFTNHYSNYITLL